MAILKVLRQVDQTFREIPSQADGRASAQFVSRAISTPNQWRNDQAGKPVPMPALGGASAIPPRFLDYLTYEPLRAVLLHGAGVPVLIPPPERYAIHKIIVGSRRKQDRNGRAKSAKDRLQARSIIEAMIENRQHADLASAFMEAWDRGDQWKAAIRTIIATYDDDFQKPLRNELAKGGSELGSEPTDYDLEDKSSGEASPGPT
ncbi:GSU2403 family nucleotidyltransferase fold protein [Bradyrhizobium sp. ISRA443]|uniref:GSU2403 family nucleotidyltransferase fold protein n=1 Tax=unclassified Bradyrhizobium TaxID=2631580 RepID=UPI0024784953|nr:MULTISPECIES: GSU2403 family nucleotidyltransferase fold protein [unclassified Bradyrhizobium]WGR93061.1 GSU2403 family nucleotidyltransferase fold protein [Bradyrhizobium sp. ISRA435]WGR97562.1 GSU2403 family nucleotidyltransferase fold protein [Bradyrhizobium sp. ISRA436]WGS04452.1 GSU2403 family nucleotidyltransferase fold protein [Bradyrhizobium sp. ISRA437]WGS11333.1 GSU2403 family nucleotidyltransferase fold protein [Bradyrhizobium sp. ISRA443]